MVVVVELVVVVRKVANVVIVLIANQMKLGNQKKNTKNQ
jgi:hypothetical protein